MEVRDLGHMEYGACLALQHQLVQEVQGGAPPVVLLVEHPPVATLGRRGVRADVFDETLPVFEIERGGKATYHGPGQLVVYPILHLGHGNRDVRAFVRHLEAFVVDFLADLGLQAAGRPDAPGVWTRGRKIASIGVAIQGWVTFHGLALNVDVPLSEFERLDPCGLGAAVMTNLRDEGVELSMGEVRRRLGRLAATHFARPPSKQIDAVK